MKTVGDLMRFFATVCGVDVCYVVVERKRESWESDTIE